MFLAVINTPGYLSEQDDLPVFDSAVEAWAYLAEERTRAEDEDDENGLSDYTPTHDRLHAIASLETEEFMRKWAAEYGLTPDGQGVVYGPSVPERMHDLGIVYSVVRIKHVDYPHTPGRLHHCQACQVRCWCDEGDAQCVSDRCVHKA